jgi:hypothetical protein
LRRADLSDKSFEQRAWAIATETDLERGPTWEWAAS